MTNAAKVPPSASLGRLLDDAERSLWGSTGESQAFAEFLSDLKEHRRSQIDAWPGAIAQCRRHSLFHFFQADPFTRRAFRKPRGYAGDPVMLDYVFGGDPGPVDEVGRAAFALTSSSTVSQSMRHRRDTFAQLIDEVAGQREHPRVASIGAGHLREADTSRAIRHNELEELVAFDIDGLNSAVVRRDYDGLGIIPTTAPLADLTERRVGLGTFDFVYSVSLFERLSGTVAQRLLAALLAMLRPGGRVTIANFTTECDGDAFLEAFMDWFLTYRSVEELPRLSERIPETELSQASTWVDTWGNVAYLDIVRSDERSAD